MPPFSEEERETCLGGGVIDVDERDRARRPADPASPSQLPASKSAHEAALAAGESFDWLGLRGRWRRDWSVDENLGGSYSG